MQTLVRTFEAYARAEQARTALLAAGFAPDAVQISSIDDEAGPVEGNFVIGNGRDVQDESPAQPNYCSNFARVVERGVHVLTVAVHDEAEGRRVDQVVGPLGAIDPEAKC
ncbi:MAG TPA: hypothetical protein VNO84_00610 [Burkholderiaceae bacterium]|nr:hypothetical protein [Burkholderiaceae bacterium]